MSLFPVFNVPVGLDGVKSVQQKYKPSPLFDVEQGDFVLNGANQVVSGSGYDAWVLWCTKAISTQRWAHLGYSSNMGIEADQAFAKSDRAAIESAFERTITEALLADPMGRTQYVRNFQFKWFGEELHISCVVFGADGNSAVLEIVR